MSKSVCTFLGLLLLLIACEEDNINPLHPLEGRYSGILIIYDSDGQASNADNVILNVDRTEGDTLLIDFNNSNVNGTRLNDYRGVISNNSSMILPAQFVNGEEHTGQGSINASEELEIIVKRLQDGSDVLMYTGSK